MAVKIEVWLSPADYQARAATGFGDAVFVVLDVLRATSVSLMEAAVASGFKSMREDAAEKVRAGLTTAEEVFRVLH